MQLNKKEGLPLFLAVTVTLLCAFLVLTNYSKLTTVTQNLLQVETYLNEFNSLHIKQFRAARDRASFVLGGDTNYYNAYTERKNETLNSLAILKQKLSYYEIVPLIENVENDLITKFYQMDKGLPAESEELSPEMKQANIEALYLASSQLELSFNTLLEHLSDKARILEAERSEYTQQNLFGFLILIMTAIILIVLIIVFINRNRILLKYNEKTEELTYERDRIRNILEGTNTGTWEWDVQADNAIINERWAGMLGYTLEEIQPTNKQTWVKHIHPDDLERSFEKLENGLANRKEYFENECRMKHKDGHWVWVLNRGKVMSWTEDGKPLLMFGTQSDISESKKLEFELKSNQAFTKAVLETVGVGIVACDKEGNIELFNRALREMHGIPEKAIKPEDWAQYYSLMDESGERVLNVEEVPLYIALKGDEAKGIAMTVRHPDGRKINILADGRQILGSDGNILGAVVAMNDVTALKNAEKVLKIKNEELENFAFIAAHDMNEPLRKISGFMTMLQSHYKDSLDELGMKYINIAVDSSMRMRTLISDLLEYAKLSSQNSVIEEIDSQEVILEIMAFQQPVLKEISAEIRWENMPMIKGFRTAVVMLFQNLISNGIKYQTAESNPKIFVSGSEDDLFWQFCIEDNGIGIAFENQNIIFQLFQRLHGKKEYSGTGMGLATCQKIVALHGGKIWVDSELGKGSKFYFTLSKDIVKNINDYLI